jgi:hypothetical protein
VSCAVASAQESSRFLDLESPGHLSLRLFAAGYGSGKYDTTHEGIEVDQTITHAVSLIGRTLAYQVYKGSGYDSPLILGRSGPRNFGLLEGGVSVSPVQGTTFSVLGGGDVGDADGPVFENDFSSWLSLQSRHPVNFSYSTSHYFANGMTNGLLDARMVALSTGRMLLLLGVGGAVWGGGSAGQAKGQGGPDVGIFLRKWRVSIDVQAGYGNSRTYGVVGFSRNFSWDE